LGLASLRRTVLGFVRFVEDEAVEEFGQGNINADFGHGEDGSVEKNVADPVAAGAGEDGRGDPVLFEDDVALDRGRGTVFSCFSMRSVLDVLGLRISKTTMGSVTTVLVFEPGEHTTKPSG
jgi:hypothetical protein